MLRRVRRLAVGAVFTILAAGLSETPAVAKVEPGFRACARVTVTGGIKAKVAVRFTGCTLGRNVARGYYAKRSGPWDGRLSDGSIYYRSHGFVCTTGLGGSEAFCKRGRARVDMSIRTDDGFPY